MVVKKCKKEECPFSNRADNSELDLPPRCYYQAYKFFGSTDMIYNLTKLPNAKVPLFMRANICECNSTNIPCVVALAKLDISGFKAFNDCFDHDRANGLLECMAAYLKENALEFFPARGSYNTALIHESGDEFWILQYIARCTTPWNGKESLPCKINYQQLWSRDDFTSGKKTDINELVRKQEKEKQYNIEIPISDYNKGLKTLCLSFPIFGDKKVRTLEKGVLLAGEDPDPYLCLPLKGLSMHPQDETPEEKAERRGMFGKDVALWIPHQKYIELLMEEISIKPKYNDDGTLPKSTENMTLADNNFNETTGRWLKLNDYVFYIVRYFNGFSRNEEIGNTSANEHGFNRVLNMIEKVFRDLKPDVYLENISQTKANDSDSQNKMYVDAMKIHSFNLGFCGIVAVPTLWEQTLSSGERNDDDDTYSKIYGNSKSGAGSFIGLSAMLKEGIKRCHNDSGQNWTKDLDIQMLNKTRVLD